MSNTLPWRTLATPGRPSDFSAPSIALPWGSSTPPFKVTITRAFIAGRSLASKASRGVGGRGQREQREQRGRIAGGAQLGGKAGAAHRAGDQRQRLQMI